ncbi:MAG: glycosyltransferase [Gammaproteobacteria bacterium]|nr:glycosyltransferase [Gammaproteobacteria bacterium]
MIRIFIGYDPREAVAYHTFCQSVLERASVPVCFAPLALHLLPKYKETHRDGSNAFIYSRFLVPHLAGYEGWALFADGDMICREDIARLWELRDPSKAVMVVKHDYKTKAETKYLGNRNADYPRKNWSSVILWNCGDPRNRRLDPDYVAAHPGSHLHRFAWLPDEAIGELPREWNWLTTEYPDNYNAKLLHYTLGTPCFKDYANCDMADAWYSAYERLRAGMGS